MKQTYSEAITQVFKHEGGYSNDVGDPGGPTNWGITIGDARLYWKKYATAEDVKAMPKSVAEDIYRQHYAIPLHYDELPAGVDYAVLDYGINSGISRSAKVLQGIVGVVQDGKIGPATLEAVKKKDSKQIINAIYDERLSFLQHLGTFPIFGKGWTRRCSEGRALALSLVDKYKVSVAPVVILGTGLVAAINWPHVAYVIIVCAIAAAGVWYLIRKGRTNAV